MKERKTRFQYLKFGKSSIRYDPIFKYNYLIRQYNNPVNIKFGIALKEAYSDKVYRFWYYMQKVYFAVLFICYLAPYLSCITLMVTLYALVIHENALYIDKKNRQLVSNLFENMVYSPELCEARQTGHIYFAILSEDLESFPFTEKVKEILRNRSEDGRVGFMVYNTEFVKLTTCLEQPRKMLWANLFVNVLVFWLMQMFVYDRLLCLNMLHPISSINRCGRQFGY